MSLQGQSQLVIRTPLTPQSLRKDICLMMSSACKARFCQQTEYLVAQVVQDYALRIVFFYISNNAQTVLLQVNKFSLICQTEF